MPKFKVGDVICNIYPNTPSTGTVTSVTDMGYIVKDFKTGGSSFGFGAEPEYELCEPPAGESVFIPPTPHFAVGQCVERNGSPKLAGKIWKIDGVYHFHRFGGADFHYGIADTDRLFHEVQCIDIEHEWSTPRPLPGEITCNNGDVRGEIICPDGSIVYTEYCDHGVWRSTGDTCPEEEEEPDEINCDTGGCALLNLYDSNNDGKVTSSDALRAQSDGRSTEEVQFILAASAAGSINAKCPGCYTPAHIPKFSVDDRLCTEQEEITHWFPQTVKSIDSTGYGCETVHVPFDWDQYLYVCIEEELPVDACTGITCPNICSDGSLFSQKCVDGICVKDALLKSPANAPECYVPPDEEPDTGEPDDEPYNEVPYLMPGQTCVGTDLHQMISGGLPGALIEANSPKCIGAEPVPPEDEGIFGDLDTKWIIIAIVAVILLGLLT